MKRTLVALAASSGVAQAQRLSIAAFGIPDWAPRPVGDPGITLIELIAFMADTLSFEQDQVANEAYVETEGGGRVRLQVCSRPALCMVADDQRAFVVAVGAETGETTVRFADGVGGKQPPSGLKKVTATYRRGAGGTGNVELTGLGLQEPFVVIVLDNLGASARHFSCRTARII